MLQAAEGLPRQVLNQLSCVPVPSLDTAAPTIFNTIIMRNLEGVIARTLYPGYARRGRGLQEQKDVCSIGQHLDTLSRP